MLKIPNHTVSVTVSFSIPVKCFTFSDLRVLLGNGSAPIKNLSEIIIIRFLKAFLLRRAEEKANDHRALTVNSHPNFFKVKPNLLDHKTANHKYKHVIL